MPARYLYGDSSDFPNGSDFLTELRQFVSASSRALALTAEAEELERTRGVRAKAHSGAMETLQAFFDGITEVINERAARWAAPELVRPYAKKLREAVAAVGEQAKSGRTRELDVAQNEVAARISDCRTKLRETIAEYLVIAPLSVDAWSLSVSLLAEKPHGEILLSHPRALTTSFTIDLTDDKVWGRPRKVEELAKGLELQVGFKKAFLRSALQPDLVELEDLVVAVVKLSPDGLELRLRRKPDAPRDFLVITVGRDPSGPVATIVRFGEGGEAEAPFTSPPEQTKKILALAETLRKETAPLLGRRNKLLFAQLNGRDVFEPGMVRVLLDGMVERMAPIAVEVAKHSPNPNELSLKVEREDGRREELYLRKAELRQMVAPLPPEAKKLFERLAFLVPEQRPAAPPPASSPPPKPPPEQS